MGHSAQVRNIGLRDCVKTSDHGCLYVIRGDMGTADDTGELARDVVGGG